MNQIPTEVLSLALNAFKERGAVRDLPNGERSMLTAVRIYNSFYPDRNMSELDGWMFMIALKIARSLQGSFVMDDYVDLAGYAGLAAECHSNEASV